MGQLKRVAPTILLAAADVLIDYRDSDLEVTKLIGQHVGPVAVLSPVLDEVHEVSPADCARLSISVVKVAASRLLRAGVVDSSVSFNNRLRFVVCDEDSWTCVTNDRPLRRLCNAMASRLVLAQARRRLGCVRRDHNGAGDVNRNQDARVESPTHERMLARFTNALDRL